LGGGGARGYNFGNALNKGKEEVPQGKLPVEKDHENQQKRPIIIFFAEEDSTSSFRLQKREEMGECN